MVNQQQQCARSAVPDRFGTLACRKVMSESRGQAGAANSFFLVLTIADTFSKIRATGRHRPISVRQFTIVRVKAASARLRV
jgi:hypothetical protein